MIIKYTVTLIIFVLFTNSFSMGKVDIRIVCKPTYPLGVRPIITIRIENNSDQIIEGYHGYESDDIRFGAIAENDTLWLYHGLETNKRGRGQRILQPNKVFESDVNIEIFHISRRFLEEFHDHSIDNEKLEHLNWVSLSKGSYFVSANVGYRARGIKETFYETVGANFNIEMPEGEDRVALDIYSEIFEK